MDDYKKIVKILEKEVTPALGCTEPVAVALAAANAMNAIGGQPEKISVKVSTNIYKNAMAVGIPGIDRVGIDVAAALGAMIGEADKGLEVLKNVGSNGTSQALELVDNAKVHVELLDRGGVFVDCSVETDRGNGRCVVEDGHTNIVLVQANGEVLKKGEKSDKKSGLSDLNEWLKEKKISEIVDMVKGIPYEDVSFMLKGRDMNLEVAQKGLKEKAGMGVGYNIMKLIEKGIMSNDWIGYAAALTAAGADVRMAGVKMPVMSSAGSGNHGLTAILPLVAVAEKNDIDDKKLAKAIALSHLITVYVKSYTGKLSPLCGCAVAAGIGASAAIAFILDAEISQIEGAIKNVIANVSGLICDGGKVGCALKLSTAAYAAVQSAVLALEGSVVPGDNGIVHSSVERTVQNLGKVSYPGMIETDNVILKVMLENKEAK